MNPKGRRLRLTEDREHENEHRSCLEAKMMNIFNRKWGRIVFIISFASLVNHISLTASEPMIRILVGNAILGVENENLEEESLLQQQSVSSFRITLTETTNAEFAPFVKARNYHTNAEKIGWR